MTFTDSCFSIMANENVECINQLEAIPSDDVKNFLINYMMQKRLDRNIALLIDADNVSAKYAATVMNELTMNYGRCIIRRIYGNWANNTGGWTSAILSEFGLVPVHQHSYIKGKNSTDITLVIDAMDILHSVQNIDTFCIVSSDCDFTRLAQRIRESNKMMIGMGMKQTPFALTQVCDRFVFLDQISEEPEEASMMSLENSSSCCGLALEVKPDTVQDSEQSESLLSDGLTESSHENDVDVDSITPISKIIEELKTILSDRDYISVGEFGHLLHKKHPSFDVRNYGFTKLTVMLDSPEFKDCFSVNNDLNPSGHRIVLLKKFCVDDVQKAIREYARRLDSGVKLAITTLHNELLGQFGKGYYKEFGFSKPSSFFKSLKFLKCSEGYVQIIQE